MAMTRNGPKVIELNSRVGLQEDARHPLRSLGQGAPYPLGQRPAARGDWPALEPGAQVGVQLPRVRVAPARLRIDRATDDRHQAWSRRAIAAV